MELTKELKEKLENAESKEEAKKILEEAGMLLTDEELDQASDGYENEGKDGFPNITPGNQIHTHF